MGLRRPHSNRPRSLGGLVWLGAILLLAGAAAGAAKNDSPGPDSSWHEGASDFADAFARARAAGQPVLVYFYADWCGYCRQLESELLYQPEVEESLSFLVKVRINPDHGPAEQDLARRYGVRGYPAVFVHPVDPEASPKKIARMVVERGKRRLMTPDEFVATLARASGESSG